MRIHIQRVTSASVSVDHTTIATIATGMLALVGFASTDQHDTIKAMLTRLLAYRLFADNSGKTNLSIGQTGGSLLLVPQFTLYANTNSGLRPSYSQAAAPQQAALLFSHAIDTAQQLCLEQGVGFAQGKFGANMQVSLVNDGPFTMLLDSD